jgi:hypothetical protein
MIAPQLKFDDIEFSLSGEEQATDNQQSDKFQLNAACGSDRNAMHQIIDYRAERQASERVTRNSPNWSDAQPVLSGAASHPIRERGWSATHKPSMACQPLSSPVTTSPK